MNRLKYNLIYVCIIILFPMIFVIAARSNATVKASSELTLSNTTPYELSNLTIVSRTSEVNHTTDVLSSYSKNAITTLPDYVNSITLTFTTTDGKQHSYYLTNLQTIAHMQKDVNITLSLQDNGDINASMNDIFN